MTLSSGQILNNRYRIVKMLGQGGFGAVYRAWDVSLERPCALKENLDTSEEAVRQFKREAVILANLSHPNLPHVIDHFSIPEQGQYLVMEFVEGEDLQSMLEQSGRPVPMQRVLPWIGQICGALSYLHSQKPPIIHRDIKPANIKITPSGKAMLVDFGIAKVFDPHTETTVGARAVTPGYSPPEQYGEGKTDARSDVYALGATLYHLLTGQPPPSSVDIMSETVAQPSPPHELNRAVLPEVSQAVMRAMRVSRTARFGSILEFQEALGLSPVSAARDMRETGEAVMLQTEKVDKTYQPAQAVGALSSAPAAKQAAKTLVAPQERPVTPARSRAEKGRTPSWVWLGCGAVLVLAALFLVGGLLLIEVGKAEPTQIPATLAEAALPTDTELPSDTPERPTELPTVVFVGPMDTPAFTSVPVKPAFLACLVTDVGGIDDQSFNAMAWRGVQLAMEKLGIGGEYRESKEQTEYGANIEAFIQEGCDIIVTTGYSFGDIVKAYAEKFPDQMFSIADYSYDPPLPNVVGQFYNTQEAAFLAGYLAAGVSKTGVLGTFGGMQIPPVTMFMDGFVLGAQYYNTLHGANVQVEGWNPNSQSGLFTGNFSNTDDGVVMGKVLAQKGADIILPVAGQVGLGDAAIAKDFGNTYMIGVDSDWYLTAPEYSNIILTSVMKNMDVTTYTVIEAAFMGNFKGGTFTGTLANNGVGLAPFHDLEKMVPPELLAELEKIKAMIIAGEIRTRP